MSKLRIRRRLNLRAALVLATLGLLAALGSHLLGGYQEGRILRSALEQVRQFRDDGQPGLAIRHLNQYLEMRPDDVAALEIRAQILAELARTPSQLFEAAKAYEQFLRRAPDGPGSPVARRRLCELYIQYSDIQKASSFARLMPEEMMGQLRYQAAEVIARQLVAGDQDPASYRLLAMALEGQVGVGNDRALREAIANYEKALQRDPGDVVAAERLARIYKDRQKDVAHAERVLDDLLKARPESVPVRLVRQRFFNELRRDDLAQAELEAAVKLQPENPGVVLAAAEDALRHGDTKSARARLDALPPAFRDDLRVLSLRGLIDFGDEYPDKAIDDWRRGLMTVGGTDADLTWWLAYALIQMGRLDEVKPLLEQYRRLDADDSPMLQLLVAMQDERLGQFGRAINRLEKAREGTPERWQGLLHLSLGRCYEGIQDEQKAEAAYRQALKIDPRSSSTWLALVRLLLRRGIDPAIAEVEQGLATLPEDPVLTVALAELRLRQQVALPPDRRSWAAFDRALKRAAAIAPRNPSVALLRADRATLEGSKEGALRVFEEAAKQDPHNAPIALAWSDSLARSGQPERALQVLERASTPEGAGDQALLRVARARLLTTLGRGREARALLVQDVDRLPLAERARAWMALGQLCASQGDRDGARKAYAEWARLLPDDTRPRLALMDLDLAAGDDAACRASIEALRTIGGPDDYAWRIAEARYQLWRRSAPEASPEARARALDTAGQRVVEVLKAAPNLPEAHRLQGEILEQRGQIDEAIVAYQSAWDRGSEAALPRLIDLLARRHRFEDLARLRKSSVALRLDQLEAQALLQLGDKDQANRLVDQVGRDQPDAQAWQAEMLERLGRIDDAEGVLQKLAERQPGDLAPWLVLLRYQAAHKRSQAVSTTIARIKSEVKSQQPEVLEARCRVAIDDRPGAEKAFDEALRHHPEDREVQISAARYFEEAGRMARAETCLRQVLKQNPSDRPVMLQLAVLLSSRSGDPGAWDAAWATLGPEGSEVQTPEDRLARAIVLSRAPDPARRQDAVKRLEALVADLPSNLTVAVVAREYLARFLLQAGQPDRASQVASVSAEMGASLSSIVLYAEALLQAKRFDAAANQLDRLEAIKPGDATAANLRARLARERSPATEAAPALEKLYLAREDAPGADALGQEIFRQLIAMGPESAAVSERLARRVAQRHPSASWMPALLALRGGRRDEALALCRTAVQAGKPGDALEACRIALEAAVTSSSDPGSIRMAGEVLEGTLKLAPESDDLLAMRAVLHHLEGRFDEEVRLYHKILARRPESPLILNNLAWSLCEGLHEPSEAMTYIEQFIKLSGRVAEALDTRGRILIRLGRPADAVKDMEEVVKAEPTATHLYHLAYAYHKAGRGDEFRKTMEQVRRAGLTATTLDSTERAEFQTLMGP